MKIVAVEPIGISEERAANIALDLAARGHEFVCYRDRKEDAATLIERMKDAEEVIVSNIKVGSDILSQCPKLKKLNVAFTGLDHIDLAYCREHGIEVVNASGYATEGVAELAIGLMLDVYRRIVGTGAIGRRTAQLLQCFGCEVVAWSRTQYDEVKAQGIAYLPLEELMKTSDIISLHVPLTAETHHLISRELLEMCKSTAILITTARGNVVDIDALADLLCQGKLAGAGIDVFEKEPPLPADHTLLRVPNCVLVPHVGYATREAFDDRIDIVLSHI